MNEYLTRLDLKLFELKLKAEEALTDEDGETNIIAIVLILAIVIALAIVFRSSIKSLFDRIWGSLFNNVDNSLGSY